MTKGSVGRRFGESALRSITTLEIDNQCRSDSQPADLSISQSSSTVAESTPTPPPGPGTWTSSGPCVCVLDHAHIISYYSFKLKSILYHAYLINCCYESACRLYHAHLISSCYHKSTCILHHAHALHHTRKHSLAHAALNASIRTYTAASCTALLIPLHSFITCMFSPSLLPPAASCAPLWQGVSSARHIFSISR